MATLDPKEAATIAHGAWAEGQPASPLTSFAIDSRTLQPGQTFVALKTGRRDGHAFLEQVRDKGALCAIVAQPDHSVQVPQLVVEDPLSALHSLARVWRQRFQGPVIGITGSYGKTTVKEILGTVMGAHWFRTYANLNNTLGVPLSLLELDSRHDAGAIIEAGINMTGEMDILADLIDPDIALVTAVGPAHLERLGDLDGVAREKARLATGVREGGHVILPASLLRFPAFREIPESIKVHAIAINEMDADIGAAQESANVTIYHYKWTEDKHSRGMGRLETGAPLPTGLFTFRAGSPGMVSNFALVVHTALHLHVPARTLQACLDGWRPFLHRGQTLRTGQLHIYADCYNANPGSMLDSVSRFKNLFAGQPQLYVLGSMDELGAQSAKWHRDTARRLELPAGSQVFLLGHGAEAMREGLMEAGFRQDLIRMEHDLDRIREATEEFSGAVFLKASRSCGLEALIPEGAQPC